MNIIAKNFLVYNSVAGAGATANLFRYDVLYAPKAQILIYLPLLSTDHLERIKAKNKDQLIEHTTRFNDMELDKVMAFFQKMLFMAKSTAI